MLDWGDGDISTRKLKYNCFTFSRSCSGSPVLLKADLVFKDFSRKPSIFEYFSSLCESNFVI